MTTNATKEIISNVSSTLLEETFSQGEIRRNITRALSKEDVDFSFVREIFDDNTVVYSYERSGRILRGDSFFGLRRLKFKMDAKGTITFTGKPVEVESKTTYRPARN